MNTDIENSRKKVLAMKKKQLIETVLLYNPFLSTVQVVENVMSRYKIQVSERSVQRVRKYMNEKGTNEMTDNNIDESWDTGEPEDKTIQENQKSLNQLNDDEITILNMANEGGWSVEQMAEETKYTAGYIRNTLDKLNHMITGEVLDEENPNVFMTKGTQDILDELDALPGGQGGHGVVATSNVSRQPARDDFWEVEQDIVTSCSKCEKSVDVFMNITSRRKAMLYMKWAGPREWLAYLVGEKINDVYYINDLYLPDQRTSATLVDNVNTDEFNQFNIVGVIHSHHEMGAGDANNPSFSGHDDAFINANHNLSLLAGRDRSTKGFKIVGLARVTTPCGAFMQVKANVKSMVEDPEGDKVLRDEFLEKTQTQTQNYGYGSMYDQNYPITQCGSQNIYPAVVVNDKRTYKPGPNGVVETRGNGFHFKK